MVLTASHTWRTLLLHHHCYQTFKRYKQEGDVGHAATLAGEGVDTTPHMESSPTTPSPPSSDFEVQTGNAGHAAIFAGQCANTVPHMENSPATPLQLTAVSDPPCMESIEQDPMVCSHLYLFCHTQAAFIYESTQHKLRVHFIYTRQ